MENKLKLLNIIKLVLLSLTMLFIINFVLVLIIQKNLLLYISLGLLVLTCALYVIYHILRAKNYIYKCPKCKEEFKISFFYDITSYNASLGKKVLVCPKCNVKEVMEGKIK